MTFHIETLGCKVNIYESEMIRQKLLKANFQEIDDVADVNIINTCSVTNMADSKSRKLVRRYKRNNPNSILIVCGCSSQNKTEEYQQMDIDILLGNNKKSDIVSLINEFKANQKKYEFITTDRELNFEDMQLEEYKNHTRAFVKIQDGCDNFCTYCIIPHVRGSIRSKKLETAIEEINTLVKNGHQEIVLTGIHTGSYGTHLGYDLTDLIHEVSKLKNLKRIRISSIEITELNEKFLNELKNNNKICDHLHIPLQTGTDEILKRMNRKYDLNYYYHKIKTIRKIRPNINITTDVIVGFPYETEELFKQTLEFIKIINFSKIHAFPYSKRTGTPAANMPNQVNEIEKKQRNQLLTELSNQLEIEYVKKHLDQELEVLIEEVNNEYSIGHTDNFIKIKVNQVLEKNKFYRIKPIEISKEILISEIKEMRDKNESYF